MKDFIRFITLGNANKDKIQHFVAGIYVYLIAMQFTDYLGAFFAVIIVAAAKEIVWDKMLGKGEFSVADFVMTVIPAGLLTFALYFDQYYFWEVLKIVE